MFPVQKTGRGNTGVVTYLLSTLTSLVPQTSVVSIKMSSKMFIMFQKCL